MIKKETNHISYSPRQTRHESSYLVFMWIVIQYTFGHEICYHRISSQGSHMCTNNGKNFSYKTVNEATQASSLVTKRRITYTWIHVLQLGHTMFRCETSKLWEVKQGLFYKSNFIQESDSLFTQLLPSVSLLNKAWFCKCAYIQLSLFYKELLLYNAAINSIITTIIYIKYLLQHINVTCTCFA